MGEIGNWNLRKEEENLGGVDAFGKWGGGFWSKVGECGQWGRGGGAECGVGREVPSYKHLDNLFHFQMGSLHSYPISDTFLVSLWLTFIFIHNN